MRADCPLHTYTVDFFMAIPSSASSAAEPVTIESTSSAAAAVTSCSIPWRERVDIVLASAKRNGALHVDVHDSSGFFMRVALPLLSMAAMNPPIPLHPSAGVRAGDAAGNGDDAGNPGDARAPPTTSFSAFLSKLTAGVRAGDAAGDGDDAASAGARDGEGAGNAPKLRTGKQQAHSDARGRAWRARAQSTRVPPPGFARGHICAHVERRVAGSRDGVRSRDGDDIELAVSALDAALDARACIDAWCAADGDSVLLPAAGGDDSLDGGCADADMLAQLQVQLCGKRMRGSGEQGAKRSAPMVGSAAAVVQQYESAAQQGEAAAAAEAATAAATAAAAAAAAAAATAAAQSQQQQRQRQGVKARRSLRFDPMRRDARTPPRTPPRERTPSSTPQSTPQSMTDAQSSPTAWGGGGGRYLFRTHTHISLLCFLGLVVGTSGTLGGLLTCTSGTTAHTPASPTLAATANH